MKIRMLHGISGSFHGIDEGVAVGQVIDLEPEEEAKRYIKLGLAEAVTKKAAEQVQEQTIVESKAVETAIPKPKTRGRVAPRWDDLEAKG